MAERVATLSLVYSSDLSKAREDLANFRKEAAAPIQIGVGLSGANRGPAGTFGGFSPASGQGSISSAPGAAPAGVVQNFYGHYAPNGAGLGPNVWPHSGTSWAPRAGGNTMQGVTPAMGAMNFGSPMLLGGAANNPAWFSGDQGSYGSFSGGPIGPTLPNGNLFSGGGGGGGAGGGGGSSWFPNFSRSGARGLLGQEGLRGLGRYLTAYGVAQTATQYLNQQNQYGIGMAGATSQPDVLRTQMDYQKNSPLGSIPIAGDLGMAIREADGGLGFGQGSWKTGFLGMGATQADIAEVQSQQGIEEETGRINTQKLLARYSSGAALAAGRGDYAGRLESINLSTQGNIKARQMETASQVTKLSGDQQAVLQSTPEPLSKQGYLSQIGTAALYVGSFGQYDRNANTNQQIELAKQKAQLLQGQINDTNAGSSEYIAQQNAQNKVDVAAAQRMNTAEIVGSNYRVGAMNSEFGNSRRAGQLGIIGGYQSRIAATSDAGEKSRLQSEQDAALGNEAKQYGRETGFIQSESMISQGRDEAAGLGYQHKDYAARNEGFEIDKRQAGLTYDKETAGLDPSDPEQGKRITAAHEKYIAAIGRATIGADELAKDYEQTKSTLSAQTQSTLQMISGDSLGANNTATNAKYDQLEHDHPELKEQYEGQRGADLLGNQRSRYVEQFGTAMRIQRLRQGTTSRLLRNQGYDISGNVSDDIAQGVDAIEEAGVQLPGEANKAQRDALIAAQRQSSMAMIQGETRDRLTHGMGLQEVSAYVTGGDRNNRSFQDFGMGQKLAGGASAAFDDAEKKAESFQTTDKNPTQQQMNDAVTKLGALVTLLTNMAG